MKLNEYFEKLKEERISPKEYHTLKRQCVHLVKKACRRYKIDNLLLNPSMKGDLYDGIYIKSILKTLKGHRKEKGSFSTYFYYKALSAARSEAGKLKRRLYLNNTFSLDESFYNKKTYEDL